MINIEKTLPIKIGYTFAGWKYQDESVNDKYTLTENITLNATWNENTLTVNYHNSKNGNTEGEMDSSVFKYSDSSAILLDNQYNRYYQITYDYQNDTKKYYLTFKGWATVDDGEKTYDNLYDIKDLVKEKTASNNFVLDLYAIYDDSTDVEIEDPTREGYEFKGWYKDSEKVENTYKLNSDITLKATWRPYKLTINYDGNGATNSVSMNHSEFTYESDRTSLETNQFIKKFKLTYDYNDGKNGSKEEKVPVEFLGWSENKGSIEATYKDSNITMEDIKSRIKNSDAEITLYAIWATSAETKITNEIPIKEGYKFYRWLLEDGSIANNTITLTTDTKINADWLQILKSTNLIESQINKNTDDYETTISSHKITVKLKNVSANLSEKVNGSILTNMNNIFNNNIVDKIIVTFNNNKFQFIKNNYTLTELFTELTNTSSKDYDSRTISSLYSKSIKVEMIKGKTVEEYEIAFTSYNGNIITLTQFTNFTGTPEKYSSTTSIGKILSHKQEYYDLAIDGKNITLLYAAPDACVIFGTGYCSLIRGGFTYETHPEKLKGGLAGSGVKTVLEDLVNGTIATSFDIMFAGMDPVTVTKEKMDDSFNFGNTLLDPFKNASGYTGNVYAMKNSDLEKMQVDIKLNPPTNKEYEDSIISTYTIKFGPQKSS